MSAVPQQCHYCEHSEADEVEHIYPKSWYPERTFLWENYLLSCGNCNVTKGDQFSIFDGLHNEISLTRKRSQSVTPPPSGSAVFIDFRKENPLDFLTLDFTTFCFTSRINQDDRSRRRAEFTIKILDLNRSFLIEARKRHYKIYCSLLEQYVTDKKSGTLGARDQERKRDNIWKQCHAMVWQEIINKREEKGMEEINGLFRDAPELLTRPPFYFPVS
ncbi:MAG: HNH endonuclease [Magnetococcales bacterium]|nr:HNH endonuclease [Magnetococcales bacterium]MBF0150332.1 HNH endonuclease [Magnetococcales bacterium]